jgi:hypothetical protein
VAASYSKERGDAGEADARSVHVLLEDTAAESPTARGPRPDGPRCASAIQGGRDVRLDFFRGLALVFIFFDHIPANAASWITSRNYGFSDATEIFVFIAGYSAAVAYGSVMRQRGFLFASARILHRTWQLYIAHIFLFVVFTAQIAYVATRFNNPMFSEEMNLIGFLSEPHVNLIQALVLRFRPANMDVLPLYIVLLFAFSPVLLLLQRWPLAVLLASGALYVVANHYNWNFAGYPAGKTWAFNPLCWQFLFVLGAWCGLRRDAMRRLAPFDRALRPLALIYLVFALLVVATWSIEPLGAFVPGWLSRLLYPIDKPNMDVLRLAHFLALAYVTLRLTPVNARFLSWQVCQPLLWCGRHSLQVFCLGIFLAFTGHFFLVEVNGSLLAQLLVSALGVALMVLTAAALTWYKAAEAAPLQAGGRGKASAAGSRDGQQS